MPWSDTGVNDSDDPGTYTCASLATYDLQTRMEAAINQDWTKIITLDADKSALAIADCIDGTIDLCEGTLSDGCLGSSFKTINESLEAWALADGKSALPLPSSNGGDPNYTYTTNHYDEACSWWNSNHPDTDIDIAGPDDDFWLNHQAHGDASNYSWVAACGLSGGDYWDSGARALGYVSCSFQSYSITSSTHDLRSFRVVVRP